MISTQCLLGKHTADSAAGMPLASHARQRNKAQVSTRGAPAVRQLRSMPAADALYSARTHARSTVASGAWASASTG